MQLKDIKLESIFVLLILALIAIYVFGIKNTLPQILIAPAFASFLDGVINFIKTKKLILSKSAIISGLIIALILTRNQNWYIPLAAAAIAIASKHLVKINKKNIFNPAALALVILSLVFPLSFYSYHLKYLDQAGLHFAQNYFQLSTFKFFLISDHGWIGTASSLAVVLLGLILAWRIKRLRLALSFLISYLIFFTVFSVLTSQDILIRVMLEFIPSGALFFIFFMALDPSTSPRSLKGQTFFGLLLALFSFIFRFILSPAYFLCFALITLNLFYSLLNLIINWHKHSYVST